MIDKQISEIKASVLKYLLEIITNSCHIIDADYIIGRQLYNNIFLKIKEYENDR